jgi:hypothetical protein
MNQAELSVSDIGQSNDWSPPGINTTLLSKADPDVIWLTTTQMLSTAYLAANPQLPKGNLLFCDSNSISPLEPDVQYS